MLLASLAFAGDPLPACQGGPPAPMGTATITAYACGNTALTLVDDGGEIAAHRAELRASNERYEPGVAQREEAWTLGGQPAAVDVADRTAPGGGPWPQYVWVAARAPSGVRIAICRPPSGGVDRCRSVLSALADGTLVLR